MLILQEKVTSKQGSIFSFSFNRENVIKRYKMRGNYGKYNEIWKNQENSQRSAHKLVRIAD